MKTETKYVEILAKEIVRETEKAVLLKNARYNHFTDNHADVWVPKSLVKMTESAIFVADWFVKREKLYPGARAHEAKNQRRLARKTRDKRHNAVANALEKELEKELANAVCA